MIELKNLTVGYHGGAILENVTLAFKQNEVTVLLGPNGCGKSTLMKTALGLLPKISGEVLYDGVPLDKMTYTQVAKQAAYMAQSRAVPSIVARRLVLHGRFAYLSFPRHYRKEDKIAVQKALERVDALEIAERPLPELSGGQRQKAYLAMALAQGTSTIFMDEPTTYLDVQHQLNVMKMARQLAAEGKAVVLVSHDLCGAMRTADTVAVLAENKILQTGTPEQIFAEGVLNKAFNVTVNRVQTNSGWQYFYE